ncbi:EB domain-containing julius seizure protein isoform X2 [Haematobia irritans]|uniref:EB domain-containing julius seizure protein isoform X2 n=1 Tax=Haematobia irritans TaxID=7368 RepID=UPI003F4FC784
MKINGALKPRHGASTQGSSPGAGQLRKYGDKRYHKHICAHDPLNACLLQGRIQHQRNQRPSTCGVNNNQCTTATINTSNPKNIWCEHMKSTREHQQQHTRVNLGTHTYRALDQQQHRRSKYLGIWNSSSNEARVQLEYSSGTKANQNKIKSVGKPARQTSDTDRSSHCDRFTTTTAIAAAAAAIERPEGMGSHNYDDVKIKKQLPYITTRQQKTVKNNLPKGSPSTPLVELTRERKLRPSANEDSINSADILRIRPYCWKKEANKLSPLVSKMYERRAVPYSSGLISRLLIQFNYFLFWLTSSMFSTGSSIVGGKDGSGVEVSGGVDKENSSNCGGGRLMRVVVNSRSNLANIMRASQSFVASLERICFKNAPTPQSTTFRNNTSNISSMALYLLVYSAASTILLPQPVLADEGDFFSPNGIVIGETTTEFDYASRGQKKFGDKCDNTLECGFPGSICDTKKKSCQCTEDLPVTNHIDKCGKEAAVNESCFFNEQCESKYPQTECRDGRCVCRFDMTPIWLKDGTVECKGRQDKKGPETYIDPAMIGVLIGMALMFIIICVVLRLFSQARWRENRTIFNTPNPRLMNVSLLRESKLLHGQERRGSRMSVRAPSRQPSMASLRPHSPNPSLGKTGSRSNSHGSNASATSLRSTRSNSVSPAVNNGHHERKGSTYHPQHHHHLQQQHPQHHTQHLPLPEAMVQQQQPNIIANPVAESISVDIIEPEKSRVYV